MRREATSVCGLKLLVYAALSYYRSTCRVGQLQLQRATSVCGLKATRVCGLKLLVYEALRYICCQPGASLVALSY
jgi:hypothetical protein